MTQIIERAVTYAIGVGATRTSYDMDEGLPVSSHAVIQAVTSGAKNGKAFSDSPGSDSASSRSGNLYYSAELSQPFRMTNVRKLLDCYFENTTPGGSPNYQRVYSLADIPSAPSEYLSLWRRAEKGGDDKNEVFYGGVVTGVAIAQNEGDIARVTTRAVFAYYDDEVNASGTWTPELTGNRSTYAGEDISITAGESGATTSIKWSSFNFSLSHAILTNFFKSRNPDRINRYDYAGLFSITVANEDSFFRTYEDSFQDSEPVYFTISFSSDGTLEVAGIMTRPSEDSFQGGRWLRTYYFNVVYVRGSAEMDYPTRLTIKPEAA